MDSSISHTVTFFLLSVRATKYIAFSVKKRSSLMDPFHLYTGGPTKFCLNQSSYFGNILINCKDVQNSYIFRFET